MHPDHTWTGLNSWRQEKHLSRIRSGNQSQCFWVLHRRTGQVGLEYGLPRENNVFCCFTHKLPKVCNDGVTLENITENHSVEYSNFEEITSSPSGVIVTSQLSRKGNWNADGISKLFRVFWGKVVTDDRKKNTERLSGRHSGYGRIYSSHFLVVQKRHWRQSIEAETHQKGSSKTL